MRCWPEIYFSYWMMNVMLALHNHVTQRPGVDIVIPIYISPFFGPRARCLSLSPHHPKSGEREGSGRIDQRCEQTALDRATFLPMAKAPSPFRTTELLFAGRICGDFKPPNNNITGGGPICGPRNPGYSQGVRQQVYRHHWNRSGFKIALSLPAYQRVRSVLYRCLQSEINGAVNRRRWSGHGSAFRPPAGAMATDRSLQSSPDAYRCSSVSHGSGGGVV